jgi:hypothetical protein
MNVTPDVEASMGLVNQTFNELTPEARRTFLEDIGKLSDKDVAAGRGVYWRALEQPHEFAAEYMGFVGGQLSVVPEPSSYLKDVMRFAPDDVSHMVKLHALRRAQAVDRLDFYFKNHPTPDPTLPKAAATLKGVFEGLARSAYIAVDQAEFYRTRGLYPDIYKQYLNTMADNLTRWGEEYKAIGGADATPSLKESEILLSREGPIIDHIREFFRLPTYDGRLPVRQSFWDKTN